MFRIQLKDINIARFIRKQKKNWKKGSFIFKPIQIISVDGREDISHVLR